MATVIAALGVSIPLVLAVLAYVAERRRQRQQLIGRYLFQLQDASRSLRMRFINISRMNPYAVRGPEYLAPTTAYALGLLLCHKRRLLVDGIYPTMNRRRHADGSRLLGLLEDFEDLLDVNGEKPLQRYDRVSLGDAATRQLDDGGLVALLFTDFIERTESNKELDALVTRVGGFLDTTTPAQFDDLVAALDELEGFLQSETRFSHEPKTDYEQRLLTASDHPTPAG